jgi:PAS domain S-box-containing protein
MRVTPLLMKGGGVVVVHRDISNLKRIQTGLQDAEQKASMIISKVPAMIWMAAADKRAVYFNDKWLDFTGRRLHQELDDGWMDGIDPEQKFMFQKAFGEAFEKRRSFTLEHRLRSATGEFKWVLNCAVPLFKGDREFIGFIGSCIDISDRRAAEKILDDLSGQLINAQEEERSRIARELHDDLSQKVALLSIEIDQLVQLQAPSLSTISAGLRKALDSVQDISSEIHRISYELHPSKLDRLGLTAATLGFCKEFSSQQSLQVDCDFKDIPDSLPREIGLCIYRVIQESLQNIIKHSGACTASVQLHGSPSEIRLKIADQGVGFSPETAARKHGLGLLSMRERLRLVQGTITIDSQPLRGTCIDVRIPVRTAHSEVKKSQRKGIDFSQDPHHFPKRKHGSGSSMWRGSQSRGGRGEGNQ